MISIVMMIRSQLSAPVAPSLSPRSEMQARCAQNLEIRDRHDQAVTVFRW
jgi:hypothetical protein